MHDGAALQNWTDLHIPAYRSHTESSQLRRADATKMDRSSLPGNASRKQFRGAGRPKQTFYHPEQCRMLQNQTEVILKLSRSCVNHGQKPGKGRQGATKMDRKDAAQDGNEKENLLPNHLEATFSDRSYRYSGPCVGRFYNNGQN